MRVKFIYVAILGILAASCSSTEEPLFQENHSTVKQPLTQSINKSDALKIADKVLERSSSTRSAQSLIPEFEYVLNERATRNSNIPDTLAYVINYPDDKGFVIVSSDRRVYPVLAFSKEGHFSFDNEIARDNFISNIGAYIAEADDSNCYDVVNFSTNQYSTWPYIHINLSQRAPWDKYVIQEHPECPVGCVAVATALVICHTQRSLEYHGTTYYTKSIVEAIENGPDSSSSNAPKRNFGGFPPTDPDPVYTYEEAVDSMAKLLYLIGKDVHMSYRPTGSGTNSEYAYALCSSLGLLFQDMEYANFDITNVARLIKNGFIVYLRGSDINGLGGHAWVSDACTYGVDFFGNSTFTDTYIRCDWGWGGSCNGFYSGSVFSASSYNFRPENFFAIKRVWDDSPIISVNP